jgi:hypothetical protein
VGPLGRHRQGRHRAGLEGGPHLRIYLQLLPVGRRNLAEDALEALRPAAEPLKGARVLHLIAAGAPQPATPPYYRELGIEVELAALVGDLVPELENGLLGAETAISDEDWAGYDAGLPGEWDIVISHGVPISGVSVLLLAVDTSRPDPALWERVRQLMEDAVVAVPAAEYAPPEIDAVELAEAIDPLGPGCADLPVALAGSMLRSLGVDTGRPCCCQLNAFDSWQEPAGCARRVRTRQGAGTPASARAGRQRRLGSAA